MPRTARTHNDRLWKLQPRLVCCFEIPRRLLPDIQVGVSRYSGSFNCLEGLPRSSSMVRIASRASSSFETSEHSERAIRKHGPATEIANISSATAKLVEIAMTSTSDPPRCEYQPRLRMCTNSAVNSFWSKPGKDSE